MWRMRARAASISTAPSRTCSNKQRSCSWSINPEYQNATYHPGTTGRMTASRTKVPACLGLFCAFRAIVSSAIVLDDRSRMEISTGEASAKFGGMPDRRGTSRFPVQEDVKYSIMLSKTSKASGIGKTLNFGSGGILLTTDEKLPVGHTVELSVKWPARLGGTCPLQVVATGRVGRAAPTTDEKLPVGHTVELSVKWPARLGGTCPLQFVATGRVVRSDATSAAVRIVRYEFRTRGAAAAASA